MTVCPILIVAQHLPRSKPATPWLSVIENGKILIFDNDVFSAATFPSFAANSVFMLCDSADWSVNNKAINYLLLMLPSVSVSLRPVPWQLRLTDYTLLERAQRKSTYFFFKTGTTWSTTYIKEGRICFFISLVLLSCGPRWFCSTTHQGRPPHYFLLIALSTSIP